MHSLEITDDINDLLDRLVAEGVAETPVDALATAVRRYAEDLDEESVDLMVAAQAGIADIEAGRFTTIASSADLEVLRRRVRDGASALAKSMRAGGESETRTQSAGTPLPE